MVPFFRSTTNFDGLVEKLLQRGEFSETELSQMDLQASDLATKTVTKKMKHQIINYIKKTINQKVGHVIGKTVLKKRH